MADDQTDHVDGQEADGSGRGGGVGKLALIPVLLIGLGGGGYLGMSALGEPVGNYLAEREVAEPAARGGGHGGGGHGESEGGAEIFMIDNLVVNPARSGGSRFLLISVAIELADPDLAEWAAGHDVEIRAKLLRVLGRKTTDELSDIENRDAVDAEIRHTIDEILGHDVVAAVFIPQFVIQ